MPLGSVVAEGTDRRPHAPVGTSLRAHVTVSPETATPLGVVTLTVILEVAVVSAGIGFAPNVSATEFRATVWLIVVDAASAALASVAVTVQIPEVVDALYVELSWPLALVVPELGLSVPHAAAGLPLVVRFTASEAVNGVPSDFLTATVTVEFWVMAAAMIAGLATTLIEAAPVPVVCCEIVAEPVPPLASVAVMVQNPAVDVAV